MADKSRLTKLLTKERFERIEGVFRQHFQLGLETTNDNGTEIKGLCSGDCHPAFCRVVRSNAVGRRRC